MSEADNYLARAKIERDEDWRGLLEKIPFIQFPPEWQVQVIPPFAGAQARFRVLLPSGNRKSVYLDCFERLGCYGKPYWEVYPYQGDVGRCDMDQVAELLQLIADESEGTVMRACEFIGAAVLWACNRWSGASMTLFVFALHVLGAYLDGVPQ